MSDLRQQDAHPGSVSGATGSTTVTGSGPDRRYFKDGRGLRPTWRFALRWPRRYLWHTACRFLPFRYAKRLRRVLGGFK